jgi:hypothetical protein
MKKKIVIASVLKPADDVRSYWKIAQSLAKTNKYELNIIGNESKKLPQVKNIAFNTHHVKRSQFLKRAFIPLEIFRKILAIKPDILIITTHELLIYACLSRLLLGVKIIYDIQENFALNYRYLFQNPFYKLFGAVVNVKERLLAKCVHSYILAEKIYAEQLGFINTHAIVLENKSIDLPEVQGETIAERFLISGTLSEYAGIEKAVAFYDKIKGTFESPSLMIVGQVHTNSLRSKLYQQAAKDPSIKLHIDHYPIPYPEILKEIKCAEFGIIAYQPNKVSEAKMPTKLFEYLRLGLIPIVQEKTIWEAYALKMGKCWSVDFSKDAFRKQITISKGEDPLELDWDSQEDKLIS